MRAVISSAAICTDKTLFTLNISNKNVQTFTAHPTREKGGSGSVRNAGWVRSKGLHIFI